MRGPRFAGGVVYQLLCISVISTDKQNAIDLLDRIYSSAHADIYRLYGPDSRALHTGMTDHIRVCKIGDDDIVLAGLNAVYQLVTDSRSTHLRF